MRRSPIARLRTLCLLACLVVAAAQAAVPTWGARQSSPADTPATSLKPGEWIWAGDSKAMGPMVVLVGLKEQRAYVYRNGVLVAVTTISSGKKGYETPTGVFTILQKDKDHRSNIYNNAPMPYQQRLTWGGVALHAGGLPGYPESHGCVHLPTEFARLLFDASNMGMTVVVEKDGMALSSMAQPALLAPVSASDGTPSGAEPLTEEEAYRWKPELAPEGPVSLVLSRSDRRLVVLRNGVEIGRSRIGLRQPGLTTGTHAYVMGSTFMPGDFPQFPGGKAPQWTVIALPGQGPSASAVLDSTMVNNIIVPRAFADLVYPLLAPGTVLVATDAQVGAPGAPQQVLDADPRDASGASH